MTSNNPNPDPNPSASGGGQQGDVPITATARAPAPAPAPPAQQQPPKRRAGRPIGSGGHRQRREAAAAAAALGLPPLSMQHDAQHQRMDLELLQLQEMRAVELELRQLQQMQAIQERQLERDQVQRQLLMAGTVGAAAAAAAASAGAAGPLGGESIQRPPSAGPLGGSVADLIDGAEAGANLGANLPRSNSADPLASINTLFEASSSSGATAGALLGGSQPLPPSSFGGGNGGGELPPHIAAAQARADVLEQQLAAQQKQQQQQQQQTKESNVSSSNNSLPPSAAAAGVQATAAAAAAAAAAASTTTASGGRPSIPAVRRLPPNPRRPPRNSGFPLPRLNNKGGDSNANDDAGADADAAYVPPKIKSLDAFRTAYQRMRKNMDDGIKNKKRKMPAPPSQGLQKTGEGDDDIPLPEATFTGDIFANMIRRGRIDLEEHDLTVTGMYSVNSVARNNVEQGQQQQQYQEEQRSYAAPAAAAAAPVSVVEAAPQPSPQKKQRTQEEMDLIEELKRQKAMLDEQLARHDRTIVAAEKVPTAAVAAEVQVTPAFDSSAPPPAPQVQNKSVEQQVQEIAELERQKALLDSQLAANKPKQGSLLEQKLDVEEGDKGGKEAAHETTTQIGQSLLPPILPNAAIGGGGAEEATGASTLAASAPPQELESAARPDQSSATATENGVARSTDTNGVEMARPLVPNAAMGAAASLLGLVPPTQAKEPQPRTQQEELATATKTDQSASAATSTSQDGADDDVWSRRRASAVPAPDIGEGWTVFEVKRGGSGSKKTSDKYWWSPEGKRFRSKAEIVQVLQSSQDGRIDGVDNSVDQAREGIPLEDSKRSIECLTPASSPTKDPVPFSPRSEKRMMDDLETMGKRKKARRLSKDASE